MNFYIFDFINQFAGRWLWLDTAGIFFASFFQYAVVSGLALLLALNFKKHFNPVALSLFSAVFARIFIELIYFIFPTKRPFEVLEVNQLVFHTPSDSFPSGHATFFFALATIIFLHNKKAGTVYFLFAFLISLARVFSGIHWPLDILGGAAVGISVALAINYLKAKA